MVLPRMADVPLWTPSVNGTTVDDALEEEPPQHFELSTIAKHFLVVGVLMIVVLILAAINAFLDYRQKQLSRWRVTWGCAKNTPYRLPTITRTHSAQPKITVKMRPNTNMFI